MILSGIGAIEEGRVLQFFCSGLSFSLFLPLILGLIRFTLADVEGQAGREAYRARCIVSSSAPCEEMLTGNLWDVPTSLNA